MRSPISLVLVVTACAGSARPPVQFVNAPPIWQVNDRRDVPVPPREHPFMKAPYHFDSFYLTTVRGLSLVPHRRALGVNSIDDVPDSTWFTNRLGRRTLTLDDLRVGPGPGSPEAHLPWTVKRVKSGGVTAGFLIADARGVEFLLKLDDPREPEVKTGAEAVSSRLLWAFGYSVPENHVVYFKPSELRIAADAEDPEGIAASITQVSVSIDGVARGLTSRFIPGKILGGTPRLGVRADDPNDRIPHELRRDLRGRSAVFAWLAHTDIKEDNSLDAWQQDPENASIHYVMHYLLDFDGSLAAQANLGARRYIGFEYTVDPGAALTHTLSLGLERTPWEHRERVEILGVGMYDATTYDPGTWKPYTFSEFPVIEADRFDKFWASKILIRFTRQQLAAAVEAGRFTDPRAAGYLTEILVQRQRLTARYWFDRVNPIDELVVEGSRVCFVDLALRHRLLEPTVRTWFDIGFSRPGGRVLARASVAPDAAGRACVPVALVGGDGYTVMHVTSSRDLPDTQVHLAIDPATRAPRVIGVYRL